MRRIAVARDPQQTIENMVRQHPRQRPRRQLLQDLRSERQAERERHRLAAGDCLVLGAPADCAFENASERPCSYLVVLSRR